MSATYPHVCTVCGKASELDFFQKEAVKGGYTECVTCGGDLRRVWTVPGVRFMGEGFYHNDRQAYPDYDPKEATGRR